MTPISLHIYKHLNDRSSTALEIYAQACGTTYSLCRVTSVARQVDANTEAEILRVADRLHYPIIRAAYF